MNKKIIAIAIAAVVAAPAAMADVKISGVANFSYYKQGGGALTAAQKEVKTNDTGSRFIVKATSGKAFAYVENHMNLANAGGNSFMDGRRFAFWGYNADFGTLTMGAMKSPMKGATGAQDLFADSSGDHNKGLTGKSSIQEAGYTQGDAVNLAIKAGGAKINIGHNLDGGATNTGDTQISVAMKAGPADVSVAILSGGTAATFKSVNYLGAKMKFGNIGVNAQYQTTETNASAKVTNTGLGAYMKAGPGKVKVQYVKTDIKAGNADLTTTSLGYAMGLSKGVGLGFTYTQYKNESTDDETSIGAGVGFKF